MDLAVRATADVWRRYSPDDYAERLLGCQQLPRDFVLVGGSPVSEGLDPDAVAPLRWQGTILTNGYAMGLPGATTSDVYHAIIHGCPTPPRLLVYGIAASDINDSRGEPHGAYSLMTAQDVLRWRQLRPDKAEWVTRHYLQARLGDSWALFRNRHGIRMALVRGAETLCPDFSPTAARESAELTAYATALRTGRGYAPAEGFATRRWDEAKRTEAKNAPFGFLDKYRTGSHLRYLQEIIRWSAERNVRLVLLEVPTTQDLDDRYAAQQAEFRTRLHEMEQQHTVPILRAYRDRVGLTDADFADLIHLNRVGANKLSVWLREQLEALDTRTPGSTTGTATSTPSRVSLTGGQP
jgi:hypothetical protein